MEFTLNYFWLRAYLGQCESGLKSIFSSKYLFIIFLCTKMSGVMRTLGKGSLKLKGKIYITQNDLNSGNTTHCYQRTSQHPNFVPFDCLLTFYCSVELYICCMNNHIPTLKYIILLLFWIVFLTADEWNEMNEMIDFESSFKIGCKQSKL